MFIPAIPFNVEPNLGYRKYNQSQFFNDFYEFSSFKMINN